jgi:hypothetical protein
MEHDGRKVLYFPLFSVLASLRIAKVQAKTCSIHMRVTNRIKIIPCFVRLKKHDLLGQSLIGNCIVNIQEAAVT